MYIKSGSMIINFADIVTLDYEYYGGADKYGNTNDDVCAVVFAIVKVSAKETERYTFTFGLSPKQARQLIEEIWAAFKRGDKVYEVK